MKTVSLYHDRTINGIEIKFSELNEKDKLEMQKLDSIIYELQYYGTANFQPKVSQIYDTEVFELHMMLYSYLLTTPYKEESKILTQILEKLYEVVIDNQDLHKLVYELEQGKKTIIPKHLKLDYIPEQLESKKD